jgi:hypothetical protein
MVLNDKDCRAAARRKLGFARELQQPCTRESDPARAGSKGYPVWYRMDQLARFDAGDDVRVSTASIYRWRERLDSHQMTGGKAREDLIGVDQMLLTLFGAAYPEAKADEITIFIFKNGGRVYNRGVISFKMKELCMTQKRTSTEAWQAFTPINLLKVELFWTRPPPLGVFQEHRRTLVNFDECGIGLEQCERSKGHALQGIRIRKPGHYTRDTKYSIIVAIEPGNPNLPPHQDGSVERPRRWVRIFEVEGTTAATFADFCDHICTSIKQRAVDTGDTKRIFLWDNLSAHSAPIVHHTVKVRAGPVQFRIVRRPPYQPKYGPIEYAFCELICRLQDRIQRNWNHFTLRQEILNVLANLRMNGGFDRTFQHCGYSWN